MFSVTNHVRVICFINNYISHVILRLTNVLITILSIEISVFINFSFVCYNVIHVFHCYDLHIITQNKSLHVNKQK